MNFLRASLSSWAIVFLCACGGRESGGGGGGAPETTPPNVIDDSGTPGELPEGGPPTSGPVHKLDVLFVVDNAPASADVQTRLVSAIGPLLKPFGVATSSGPAPIDDVHAAVISSSLGSFGTSWCDDGKPHQNDHAYRMPRAESTECTGITADSLTWSAGGDSIDGDFANKIACVVRSIGSDGCSYPQPLEAAYRFLSDPDPYQTASVDCAKSTGGDLCGTNFIRTDGVDASILDQRKAFLRPDSYLLVVLASALDDMSLQPSHLNWLPWAYAKGQMQHGWDECATVPDDFEPSTGDDFNTLHTTYNCFSCFENAANPACSVPWPTSGANVDVDARPLRNFLMTNRWGYNFLWGRQRYVDGFSNTLVPGVDAATGNIVGKANPIFAGGVRTRDMVQVIAFAGASSTMKTTALESDWQRLVSANPAVRDAHMIPSIAPRAGVPKFVGDVGVDAINGGDRDVPNGDELQWACIGKRTPTSTPRCASPDAAKTDPLCAAGGMQTSFGATPALRLARVAHALGPRGHLVSVCEADPGAAMEDTAFQIIDATIHR